MHKVSGMFSKNGISINQVKQEADKGEYVQIIIITHETQEFSVRKTLEKLESTDGVVSIDSLIRVEE